METPIDYYYSEEGKEWTRKHNWVNTNDKTFEEVLQEIKDKLSERINWKRNIELMQQTKLLLFMQFEDGENIKLYADMNDRINSIADCINSIADCEKYKMSKKIEAILNDQISEAKFNIEYFFRTHHKLSKKQ